MSILKSVIDLAFKHPQNPTRGVKVTSVTTDSRGNIQQINYDGVPPKSTRQKIKAWNKKDPYKLKW